MASYDDDRIPDMVNAPAKFINPNKPTPFPFQQRQAAIEARKARMTQLMKQQMTQPEVPEGAMVSGHYVAPAWSQQLAALAKPLAAAYAGGKEQEAIGKDTAEYEQADRAAALEHALSAPGVVASGEDREGNPIVPPATPEAKIQWAEQGMHIPSRKEMLTKLVEDLTIQEPIRAGTRGEKRLDREDKQTEAARKQADDLAYRRERDLAERTRQERHDQDMAQLRRDLAERGGGGGKASDFRQEVAADGSISYYNPLTGERRGGGGVGKPSATFEKASNETREAIERATTAISEAPRVKELLEQGSSSGLRADIRRAGAYAMPETFGGKALEADTALKPLADKYLKSVPRFEGPQSDKDVASYIAAAGQLANTQIPPAARVAALNEVVRLTQKSLDQLSGRPTTPAKPPPSRADAGPVTYAPGAAPAKPGASKRVKFGDL